MIEILCWIRPVWCCEYVPSHLIHRLRLLSSLTLKRIYLCTQRRIDFSFSFFRPPPLFPSRPPPSSYKYMELQFSTHCFCGATRTIPLTKKLVLLRNISYPAVATMVLYAAASWTNPVYIVESGREDGGEKDTVGASFSSKSSVGSCALQAFERSEFLF